MKALFLTADLGGNLPPTLAVARALARRGLDIEFAGVDVEAAGFATEFAGATGPFRALPFAPALDASPERGGKGLRKSGALLRLVGSRRAARLAASLVADHRPDVTIVDCALVAPLRGALAAGAPTAVLFHGFGSFWGGTFDRGPAGLALAALGIRPRALWLRAAARIVMADPALDPGSGSRALRDFTWVGTSETGSAPLDRGSRPRVLVALSSTDFPGMLPVYRRIIAALSTLAVDAVVTTGGVDLGGPLTGAPNVEVRGWVGHDGLLPAMDLVIGHGGHSTTMKALANGVPLLVIPVNPISDQRQVGRAVAAAGLGATLRRGAGTPELRATISALLGNTAVRDAAAAAGIRLRATPSGAEVAAARLLAVIRDGRAARPSGSERGPAGPRSA